MIHKENSHSESDNPEEFSISLEGYYGPIDLLLDLAKKQKVDLSEISILELAEQYIQFIKNYKNIHLEVVADYLVMAAWLTYLKSRLLLPKDEKIDEYTSEELEEALRYQLQRLETIQKISKTLSIPIHLLTEIYFTEVPQKELISNIKLHINQPYMILLKTYSSILLKNENISNLTINTSELYSVVGAIERLKGIFGSLNEWTNFMNLIPKFGLKRIINKSSISSNFCCFFGINKKWFYRIKTKRTLCKYIFKNKTIMTIKRDIKIMEAILFASREPVSRGRIKREN